MELLKYKINLDESIDRNSNSQTWGSITANTFYVNVFLTQNIDDMGLFTDMPFLATNNIQTLTGQTETDLVTLRYPGKIESDYYYYGGQQITAFTESKIDELKSYKADTPYLTNFNINSETYTNFSGETINGVSRILSIGNPTVYVFDANDDINLGTDNQRNGLIYEDYQDSSRTITTDGENFRIPTTVIKYFGQGKNETNTSLSALTKEEYLFGIISPPETENDVFIDRGETSVSEKHLRLSEIKTLDELSRYGNKYYNVNS